jgi:drug/metabolite transporter (DMT)-like permease
MELVRKIKMWIILVLISALLYGIWQVVEKKIVKNVNVYDFLFIQSIFEFTFGLLLLKYVTLNLNLFLIVIFITGGIIAAIVNVLVIQSLKHSDISAILPLQNLTPVFLLFVAFIFLNEVPTFLQLFGIIAIIFGTYLISVKSLKSLFTVYAFAKTKYIIFMIIAAFLMSLLGTIAKYSQSIVNAYTYMFFFVFTLFICNLFIIILQKRSKKTLKSFKGNYKIIFLAAALIFSSDIFMMKAMQNPIALAILIMPIKRMSTLFSTIIGGKLFKEKNLTQKIIACSVMIVGVFFISIG